MDEKYFALAPQMRAYLREKSVYTPYVMESSAPGVNQTVFSTDEYGLRTTLHAGERLTLTRYKSADFEGRRAALVGNSTAYGVGASSDAHTIATVLNGLSPYVWYNFSGRRYQSTQELLLFLLMAPESVERVVILSGVNNFDGAVRWFNEASIPFPPFRTQELYRQAIEKKTSWPPFTPGWRRYLQRILVNLCKMSGMSIPDQGTHPFLPPTVTDRYFVPSSDMTRLIQDPDSLLRSLESLDRDLGIWAALSRQRGGGRIKKTIFMLQPIPEWLNKAPSPEERTLFGEVAAQRGEVWEILSGYLTDKEDLFRSRIRESCGKHGIEFYDANDLPQLKSDAWLFLDRYHLTDRGQRLLAAHITDILS